MNTNYYVKSIEELRSQVTEHCNKHRSTSYCVMCPLHYICGLISVTPSRWPDNVIFEACKKLDEASVKNKIDYSCCSRNGADVSPKKVISVPEIEKVVFSDDKTIIIWKDKTKTIVGCSENDYYDPYSGFCAAIVKKMFGSTSAAKKIFNKYYEDPKCNKNLEAFMAREESIDSVRAFFNKYLDLLDEKDEGGEEE